LERCNSKDHRCVDEGTAEGKQDRGGTTDTVQSNVDQLSQNESQLWVVSNLLEDHLSAEVLIEIRNGIYVRDSIPEQKPASDSSQQASDERRCKQHMSS
jgi:hypothetical protein